MSQPRDDRQDDLFRPSLEKIINLRHPLVRLAAEIDWDFLAGRFSSVCRLGPGQPPLPTRSRALKYPLDKHLYAQRHLVECCFSKLKQFRRVATRFEKTARNYRAVVTLAAIILWMR